VPPGQIDVTFNQNNYSWTPCL